MVLCLPPPRPPLLSLLPLQVASSLAQVVRAPGVRTTVAHVSLPSSAGIITSQVRAAVTSGSQVVITSAGTGSQAMTTPTGTATLTGMHLQNTSHSCVKNERIPIRRLLH